MPTWEKSALHTRLVCCWKLWVVVRWLTSHSCSTGHQSRKHGYYTRAY